MKNFSQELEKYCQLIESDKNFCIARYADGEVLLMKGASVGPNTQAYRQDRWSSPSKLTTLGSDLLKTLDHTENNYHYAITSPNQSYEDYKFLKSRIKQNYDNLTFSDIWINNNHKKFKSFIQKLNIPINLVCNKNILNNKNNGLQIKSIFPVENDCVNFYEYNKNSFINDIKNYCNNFKNELVFISAGPLSEIIIHEMFCENPNNKYIDIGSSLDEFIHGRVTRPYMIPGSEYSSQIVLWDID